MFYGNTGLQSLGVSAKNPPDMSISDHRPTGNDYTLYREKHLWFVDLATTPKTYEVWFLASKENYQALWLKIYPSAGSVGGYLRSEDLGIEEPDPATGAINVYGGEPYLGDTSYINMYTTKLDDYTLYVNLKRSICQPFTNATGTEGVYSLGKVNFLHAFGTNNTFLGLNSVSIPSVDPVNAKNNTAVGAGALTALTLSENCTAIGYNAAHSVSDGVYVTAIGSGAGSALGPSDSSCILIGHPGVNSDNNLARIGVSGTGDGEIDKFYLGGVWNRLPTVGKDTGLVIIDADEKLSTYNTETNSILGTDANGNPIALKGDVGTFLVGHGLLPADPYPSFLSFKLDDPVTPTVTWTTDPVTGQIILTAHAGGAAGITSVSTDAGTALPAAGVLSILGGELIETDAATPNAVTVNLTRGSNNQIIVGNTSAASTYRTLLSSDGSIDVDFSNPAQVNLKLLGIPPVGGVSYLMDHALLHVPPISNGIQIEQGANITTVGDALNAKITVSVTDSVELPSGHLLTRDYIETTAGDIISDAGNLRLPVTTATGTQGIIKLGGVVHMHMGGSTSISNIFVGANITNYTTIDTSSAIFNSALGKEALKSLTTSAYNTAIGGKVLDVLTSGYGNNTSCGYASGSRLLTGAFNTYLGEFAGYDNTGSESHNLYIRNKGVPLENRCIRIGTDGAVDGGQTACYIAAIYGKTPGPSAEMVTIGSDGKLGTAGIPSGGATLFQTNSGTATVSGTTIKIYGGYNIGTRGTGNTVLIDLDDNIGQSTTSFYCLGSRGSPVPSTGRFMHATGTSSTYLGLLAGSYTLPGGTHCVGIGTNALKSVSGGSNLVAIGSGAASNITSSAGGIFIGPSAGSVYTTARNNIIIGNGGTVLAGESAETYTTRIGYREVWSTPNPTHTNPDPVPVLTTAGTNATYLYGVFNKDVDYSALPVYVDQNGKLGTNATGYACLYAQVTDIANVTGDGTVYYLGTSSGPVLFTKKYDSFPTGKVIVGGGTTRFRIYAPVSGKYCIGAYVRYYNIPPAPAPTVARIDCLTVYTSNGNYQYSATPYTGTTTTAVVSESVVIYVYLDANDNVYFSGQLTSATGAKNVGISGTSSTGGYVATYIYAYRIA